MPFVSRGNAVEEEPGVEVDEFCGEFSEGDGGRFSTACSGTMCDEGSQVHDVLVGIGVEATGRA